MTDTDVRGTAIHESAHGVVGEALGHRCIKLSLIPSGRASGWAQLSFTAGPLQQAVVAAAGIAAKNKYLGRNDNQFYLESLDDVAASIQTFRELGWDQKRSVDSYSQASTLAKSIVGAKWEAIKHVAGTLILLRELSGNNVRMLIEQADKAAARPSSIARHQRPKAETLAFQVAAPATLRDDQRTVDAVWFTGTDVLRLDPWTDTTYTLRFDPNGADLARLNARAPVLDSHNTGDILSQLGCVDRAWESGGKFLATLRFSRRPAMNSVWQDIKDGILSKFSMGVELVDTVDSLSKNGKLELRTATRWRPYEISLLSVPADFGTTTLKAVPSPMKAVPPWLAAQSRQRQIDALRLG